MIGSKSVLALIPARACSKRFPGKNLAKIGKFNLIQIAFRVAQASKYIDRIIVSSDSQEILSSVPKEFRLTRPAHLAIDSATSESVAIHALSLRPSDLIVLLQPTSPCRTAEDIDSCIEAASTHPYGAFTTTVSKPNGAVYCIRSSQLKQQRFSGIRLARVWMPQERSIDIDNPRDLDEAKSALRVP